jgi:NADH-quinone oxidoreductase subunit N
VSAADLQALLPLLILTLGASALLLVGAFRPRWGGMSLCGVALALLAALAAGALPPTVSTIGGMLSAGPYARFCTILWCALAALTLLLSVGDERRRAAAGAEYAALVLFAAAGMSFLSAATTLVGLFLGLESLTLALYILIAFDKASSHGGEAGLKYLVLGAVATGLLAFGIALLYCAAGSFGFAEVLALFGARPQLYGAALLGWGLLLAALAFKLSLAPFHLWTPDVYQGAPAPVTGLLAAGSKGGVVTVLIVLAAAASGGVLPVPGLLSALAVVTLAAGSLAALTQQNVKRMLAYSSVGHMGTILLALVAGGEAGRSAALFYVIAYAAATVAAFGVVAALATTEGEVQDYHQLHGLAWRRPWCGAVLTVALLSLAGIPATAGFVAKFGVFLALLQSGHVGLALAGVAAALVSVYYYLRLVTVLYLHSEERIPLSGGDLWAHTALFVCLVAIVFLGLYPGPLLDLIAAVTP